MFRGLLLHLQVMRRRVGYFIAMHRLRSHKELLTDCSHCLVSCESRMAACERFFFQIRETSYMKLYGYIYEHVCDRKEVTHRQMTTATGISKEVCCPRCFHNSGQHDNREGIRYRTSTLLTRRTESQNDVPVTRRMTVSG
jgi:hypothetical protein